jgi:signal transduction histidine kinase
MDQRSTSELEALVDELRAQVKARDDFIAVAAHELRNPMTPLLGQVQHLLRQARRDGLPEGMVKGLERLELITLHYVRRASTLLEISRINTSGIHLEPSWFDLSTLVAETVEAYRPIAERSHCLLSTRIEPGVEGEWDRLALEQVFDNLLSNAIKYGYGHPIEVSLARAGDRVRLGVRDHGPGISAEDQARVFERFEQAVGQRRHGGFGIGLWLARQLVEAMGGQITVKSVGGDGSDFSVFIPVGGQGQMERTEP